LSITLPVFTTAHEVNGAPAAPRVAKPGGSPALTAGPFSAPSTALIELRQVVKTYHSTAGDFTALRGVDLRVEAGAWAAIVGKSGCGKTTLINMITGIDRPTAGEVWVNGTAVHALSESDLSPWRGRQLGVIFQFFQLLPTLTLVQNVMLPMDFCRTYPVAERRARALDLLAQVGMADNADKLPSAVAGGEQQRVAIARALANDPPILVADEPTGNLDSQAAEVIYDLFERLTTGGKTILMVTHDREQMRRVTHAIVMRDGAIVETEATRR